MSDKQLEKPLTTQQEAVQWLVDRFFQVYDGQIEEYKERLQELREGKPARRYLRYDTEYYKKHYGNISKEKALSLTAGWLFHDVQNFNDRMDQLGVLLYCNLLTPTQYAKTVTDQYLKRWKIIDKILGEIIGYQKDLEESEEIENDDNNRKTEES